MWAGPIIRFNFQSTSINHGCNAGGGGRRNLEARPQERFWRVFHQEFFKNSLCGNWTVSEIFLNTALFERVFIPIIIMNSIFLNFLIEKAKMPRIQYHLACECSSDINWYHSQNNLIILINFNRKLVVLAAIGPMTPDCQNVTSIR